MGITLGSADGASEGLGEGAADGRLVGADVGLMVGADVGLMVGSPFLGALGAFVALDTGIGAGVGRGVGAGVGAFVAGTLFPLGALVTFGARCRPPSWDWFEPTSPVANPANQRATASFKFAFVILSCQSDDWLFCEIFLSFRISF